MAQDRVEVLLERVAVALEAIATHLQAAAPAGAVAQPVVAAAQTVLRQVAQAEGADSAEAAAVSLPAVQMGPGQVLGPFLAHHGISIKVLPQAEEADRVIDSLALYLGDNYAALATLLGKMKRTMQKGEGFTESLKDRPQSDVTTVCQFATRLHEIAFLEQYQYQRSPAYLIRAKTSSLPMGQRFFGGQWLERYIWQKVKAVHARACEEFGRPLSLECLVNPQIVLPNGDDFELDILASIGGNIYWIEAKTGDYQQHVNKYAKFAKQLGLDRQHSWMVLSEASPDRCDTLSALFGMQVSHLQGFEARLWAQLQADEAAGLLNL